jgi:hypothetical protein
MLKVPDPVVQRDGFTLGAPKLTVAADAELPIAITAIAVEHSKVFRNMMPLSSIWQSII